MNIFYAFNTTKAVNIGKVRGVDVAGKNILRVTYDNGDAEIISTHNTAEDAAEQFGKTILQIIPCAVPTYNVYDNHDGSYFHERADYLALCADGAVRSLSLSDGFMELAEEASNFEGFYGAERLHEYPINVTESE